MEGMGIVRYGVEEEVGEVRYGKWAHMKTLAYL